MARLVATGMTSREIAGVLSIAVKTVEAAQERYSQEVESAECECGRELYQCRECIEGYRDLIPYPVRRGLAGH
ncbi:hypothetical protein ACQ86N_15385 [Puia sp. P3]|uniref:hypothetical protein n=1 Tax=Puia sp. P3 TaxID=3423952 RepID=UPI003D678F63